MILTDPLGAESIISPFSAAQTPPIPEYSPRSSVFPCGSSPQLMANTPGHSQLIPPANFPVNGNSILSAMILTDPLGAESIISPFSAAQTPPIPLYSPRSSDFPCGSYPQPIENTPGHSQLIPPANFPVNGDSIC